MSTDALTRKLQERKEQAEKFPALLEKAKTQLMTVLPKHISIERMMRLALAAYRSNADLPKCTTDSVLKSIFQVAQMGLELGINGQAYLIPYKDICTAQIGWKGWVELINRSERGSVTVGAVYDGDEFDYEYGTNEYLRHKPGDMHGLDESKLLYCYAIGKVFTSEGRILSTRVVVLSTQWLKNHRDKYNKVGNKHYSYQNFEAYGRKIALLRVKDFIPMSVELRERVAAAEQAEREAGELFDGAKDESGDWSFMGVPDEVIDTETGEVKSVEVSKQ